MMKRPSWAGVLTVGKNQSPRDAAPARWRAHYSVRCWWLSPPLPGARCFRGQTLEHLIQCVILGQFALVSQALLWP